MNFRNIKKPRWQLTKQGIIPVKKILKVNENKKHNSNRIKKVIIFITAYLIYLFPLLRKVFKGKKKSLLFLL